MDIVQFISNSVQLHFNNFMILLMPIHQYKGQQAEQETDKKQTATSALLVVLKPGCLWLHTLMILYHFIEIH